MIILTIKTDQPVSQFRLYKDYQQLASIKYLAHRDLASTIHLKIHELLKSQDLDWSDIQALACFKGPGSFSGLRIGITVANSLAYGLNIPIIGEKGRSWQSKAIKKLLNSKNDQLVYPFYGAEPHTTSPRK